MSQNYERLCKMLKLANEYAKTCNDGDGRNCRWCKVCRIISDLEEMIDRHTFHNLWGE